MPASVTDLAFMKDWGVEQDARDLGTAIGVARFTRAITGSGFGKVVLLGWSRGGIISYAYLGSESQLPAGLRQVSGFIPADIYLKTDVPQFQAFACQREQQENDAIAGGAYATTVGGLVSAIGSLAVADPNGASFLNGPPFNLPGFTNRQAGLLVGEATFGLQGGLEPAPFYHMTGGTFDAEGKPAGLLYANDADLFALEVAASPVQPNRELADSDASICGQNDVAFDDHLGDITVPVLYVGAGGGFGELGVYTTTLLGSSDVTTHIVSKVPSAARILDFGHADLFLANDADVLVWQPILDWVQAH